MLAKITALLEVLTRGDVCAEIPVRRQRFADLCRHWANIADPRPEPPKSGVLKNLKDTPRDD